MPVSRARTLQLTAIVRMRTLMIASGIASEMTLKTTSWVLPVPMLTRAMMWSMTRPLAVRWTLAFKPASFGL